MADMNRSIEYSMNIDTNNATNNIDKLEKSLNKAADSADELKSSMESAGSSFNSKPVENLGKSFEKTAEQAETLKTQTDNIKKVSEGLQGSIQLAVGSLALFGAESEEVTKIMAKMSAVMVLTDGLKKIGEGAAAMVNLAKSTKNAEKATKLLNLEILKNPYVAIAAAILAVIAAVVKLTEAMKNAAIASRGFDNAIKELGRDLDDSKSLEDYTVRLMQIDGASEAELIKRRQKGAIERYNMQVREYNNLLRLKRKADGDISEEEQEHINNLKTALEESQKEIRKLRQDERINEYKEIKEANKKKLEEEKAAAEKRKELYKQIAADRKAISEEIRRSGFDEKGLELDDLDKWNKEAIRQAHKNKDLLLAIEEEYQKRRLEIVEKYQAQEREDLINANLDKYDLESAKNTSWLNEGNIDEEGNNDRQLEYLNRQMELEIQKLNLIDETTAAYYQQIDAIEELNRAISEEQAKSLYNSMDAWSKWQHNTTKAQKEFKKQWESLDIAQRMEVVNGTMSQFGGALNDMFGAIMSNLDENSEAYRGLAITQTVITTLMGIMNAITSAFSPANAWMTVIGQASLAAVQSAAVLAAGIASITQMKSANENSNPSSAAANITSGSIISENAVTGISPSTLSDITSPTQSTLDQGQKVYVLTTDIDKKQRHLNNVRTSVKF